MSTNSEAQNFFQPGDFFILDRGFRDCISFLRSKDFNAYMPAYKPSRASQLSTDGANKTRKVTKVRYVIECMNGLMKGQFRMIREVLPNKSLHKLDAILRVCCALVNAFHQRIESDVGYQTQIAETILSREGKENLFAKMVEEKGMHRLRTDFELKNIDEVHTWFSSEITMDDLYFLAAGTYQLKYCASYYHDMRRVNMDGILFELYNHRNIENDIYAQYGIDCDGPLLLRTKLRSRHKRGTEENQRVLLHCMSGARTSGCCAHVLTVIWYGSIGSLSNPPIPAAHLESFAMRISEIQEEIDI
uniref:DDE Tnp4 domain-containing protein n=1 Tax=Tetranychus urticae TaxID=32264 RepID=T1K796_TETUR